MEEYWLEGLFIWEISVLLKSNSFLLEKENKCKKSL